MYFKFLKFPKAIAEALESAMTAGGDDDTFAWDDLNKKLDILETYLKENIKE